MKLLIKNKNHLRHSEDVIGKREEEVGALTHDFDVIILSLREGGRDRKVAQLLRVPAYSAKWRC